jgi:hypothetical protein
MASAAGGRLQMNIDECTDAIEGERHLCCRSCRPVRRSQQSIPSAREMATFLLDESRKRQSAGVGMAQWKALSHLSLFKSKEAQRAVTGHGRSAPEWTSSGERTSFGSQGKPPHQVRPARE